MKAPVGGDCGGVAVEIDNSLGEESSSEEMSSCATRIGAESGRPGATTTACSEAPTVQQLVCAAMLDPDAGAQQLCAVLCAVCRQIPNGASNEPIKKMANAARWKALLRITGVYHGGDFTK